MFLIRHEQYDTLGQASRADFEARMVQHLNQFFPNECRKAGPERVLAAIRQGIERAAGYRIVGERDVARYIDLSVVLGLKFDTSRRYPWAAEILNDPRLNGDQKVRALLHRAKSAAVDEEAQGRGATPGTGLGADVGSGADPTGPSADW